MTMNVTKLDILTDSVQEAVDKIKNKAPGAIVFNNCNFYIGIKDKDIDIVPSADKIKIDKPASEHVPEEKFKLVKDIHAKVDNKLKDVFKPQPLEPEVVNKYFIRKSCDNDPNFSTLTIYDLEKIANELIKALANPDLVSDYCNSIRKPQYHKKYIYCKSYFCEYAFAVSGKCHKLICHRTSFFFEYVCQRKLGITVPTYYCGGKRPDLRMDMLNKLKPAAIKYLESSRQLAA